MPKEDIKEDIHNQEESHEETETSYDDEFESQWGDGESKEPASNPIEEVEEEPAAAEPTDEGTSGEEPATDPDDPYHWINELPDEVREQAARLKHAAEADRGRVAAYNKKLRDLRLEMDRMKLTTRPSEPEVPATSDANTSSSAAPTQRSEKLEKLKEDFPEFADALEDVINNERTVIRQELQSTIQPLKDEARTLKQREFDDAVDAAAEEIFDTKNTGITRTDIVESADFLAWLADQPPSVQQAASTPVVDEAVYVLKAYERDYQAAVAALNATKDGENDAGEAAPNKADKLKAERTRKKEKSVAPGSKPIGSTPSPDGGSYDDEFDRQWG